MRITVKKVDEHGGAVSFTQLSEGELQMLTVLGLMRITREDHCLFLLDEPDTHLNPIWKLRYFDDIEGVLGADPGRLDQGQSQILITTHDPMMVGSLRARAGPYPAPRGRWHRGSDAIRAPQGKGVAGLLKSELFDCRRLWIRRLWTTAVAQRADRQEGWRRVDCGRNSASCCDCGATLRSWASRANTATRCIRC